MGYIRKLSFIYTAPLGSSKGGRSVNFTRSVTSFSLERGISDYRSGTIDLDPQEPEVLNWLINGHGRDITAVSDNGVVVWRGFVEGVSVEQPGVNVATSITNLANRIAVTVRDPIIGDSVTTSFVDQGISIERYGTFQEVYSGGDNFLANAESARDSLLKKIGFPEAEKTLSGRQDGDPAIKLSLATYEKLLDYPYSNTTEGFQTRKEKVQAILDGHPDALFSSAIIEDDTFSFDSIEDRRSGLSIIKDMCDYGGSGDDQRRIFWLDKDLILHLESIPQTISYIYRFKSQQYLSAPFGQVDILDIKPGKWLYFPDIQLGGSASNLEQSRQSLFIESVSWTGGRDGEIEFTPTAGSVSTIKQALAKLSGTGGM